MGTFTLAPDLGTMRKLSWLDRTALVICDAELEPSHEPVEVAPRSILRKQVERLRAAGVRGDGGVGAGVLPVSDFVHGGGAGRVSRAEGDGVVPGGLQPSARDTVGGPERGVQASPGGVGGSGGVHEGEFGRGQHELNIRYAPALEMADRHVILKQAVKEVSEQLGASVTFMAKPDAEQAGSSSHLHVSLWQVKDGLLSNAFSGDGELAGIGCSEVFRWFLGGWMRYVPELMVCYAPTVNSYKRFQAGSWAPTATAWSPDNRTAGFRVVGSGESLRIECRIPGADVNPYLAYSAVIASGLAGIEGRIEPPPGVYWRCLFGVGGGYAAREP